MSTSPTGHFVWQELITPDVPKAKAFYQEIFNWTIKETPQEPVGVYTMINVGEMGIGGMMSPPQAPTMWLNYIGVDSVDDTVKKALDNGATAMMAGMDLPDVGRIAVLQDPQGATFGLYQSAKAYEIDPARMPGDGEFCWFELKTTDPVAAGKFYSALFDWDLKEMDGPMGLYLMVEIGGHQKAGIMNKQPGESGPPAWLSYVVVDDVDAATDKAKSLGAQVFMAPMDIPSIGRFSVIADPTGGVIAPFKWTGE